MIYFSMMTLASTLNVNYIKFQICLLLYLLKPVYNYYKPQNHICFISLNKTILLENIHIHKTLLSQNTHLLIILIFHYF